MKNFKNIELICENFPFRIQMFWDNGEKTIWRHALTMPTGHSGADYPISDSETPSVIWSMACVTIDLEL